MYALLFNCTNIIIIIVIINDIVIIIKIIIIIIILSLEYESWYLTIRNFNHCMHSIDLFSWNEGRESNSG